MTLLTDIEAAAVDSTVPLPDLLRRRKVLAARLKHQEFARWIANELDGYGPDEPLPDYRRVRGGHLVGDYVGSFSTIKGHAISLSEVSHDLREALQEHRITDSVGALINLLSRSDVQLGRPLPALHVKNRVPRFVDMELLSVSQPLDRSDIAGILDTVRNRVLDFALAIEAEEPSAGEVAPGGRPRISEDRVTNIYHTTIHGGQANILQHPGGLSVGDNYTSNIKGSTVGAVAIGANAQAAGSAAHGTSALTQEQHRTALKEAQAALIRDQDTLDQIDARLYEALGQFLRLAREIQVEQQGLAVVQAKMKETLDEVWSQQHAKGLKVQTIPKTMELAEALMKNPAMTEVLKNLLGP